MSRYRPDESAIEREQIEYVFGLTGGELASEPWTYQAPYVYSSDSSTELLLREHTARYWYDGCPDYCERSEREEWEDAAARTIVVAGGGYLSAPAPWVVDDEGAWRLVATYQNSGETECPGQHEDAGNKVRRDHCKLSKGWPRDGKTHFAIGEMTALHAECVLCEETIGEEHGYIYLGDGYEAVYSLEAESNTTREEWERDNGRTFVGRAVECANCSTDTEKARDVIEEKDGQFRVTADCTNCGTPLDVKLGWFWTAYPADERYMCGDPDVLGPFAYEWDARQAGKAEVNA